MRPKPMVRAESREDMRVTTVALPVEMHRRLAIATAEDNVVAKEIVRRAVGAWLARRARRRQ